MLNNYLHCSLKFSGFSESVINKIVAFLMSDCFDCFVAWKISESRLMVFRQVRLNGAGRKPFTQVSYRVMNGPWKFGSCWYCNAYKLLVGGCLLVLDSAWQLLGKCLMLPRPTFSSVCAFKKNLLTCFQRPFDSFTCPYEAGRFTIIEIVWIANRTTMGVRRV